MTTLPSIGICIPTRNQSEFIGDALRSAFDQTIAPCDVVVSDDAGTDDTAAVVERFRETLPREKQQVLRYSRGAQCLGIGGNFDRAVRLSRGEFVIKLDSDDMLEPDFSKILGDSLRANPLSGWAHCNVLNIRPDGGPIGLAHTRKRTGFYAADAALPRYFQRNDTCHCVMLRKAAYEATGGYRPEMKTCEDWLLWLEMLLAGWGYSFDERPLARMRKYAARPELMSKRRLDFVDSVKLMVSRLEALCQSSQVGNERRMDERLLIQLREEVARLCVCSGADEGDRVVRQALFGAACEFNPSPANRAWRAVGSWTPAGITRWGMWATGMPRRWARAAVQHFRPNPA
jgi:glycosyltransferase involved in cell wall biosynthesis